MNYSVCTKRPSTDGTRSNKHKQTDQQPFPVDDEIRRVAALRLQQQIDAGTVVGPRSELHRTALLVKRKPRDVDLARTAEQSWRDPETVAVRRQDNVRWKCAVDIFVGATSAHQKNKTRLLNAALHWTGSH